MRWKVCIGEAAKDKIQEAREFSRASCIYNSMQQHLTFEDCLHKGLTVKNLQVVYFFAYTYVLHGDLKFF